MKQEASKDTPGMTKKFLYSGPRAKGARSSDSEEEWDFGPSKSFEPEPKGLQIDLNSVWNIRQNVTVTETTPRYSGLDGKTLNGGKGYYSRHGASLQGDNEFDSKGMSELTPRSWSQQKMNYSYSVGDKGRLSQASNLSENGGQTTARSNAGGWKGSTSTQGGGRYGGPTYYSRH